MTYGQAIARLNQKVRDSEAWPSGSGKLSEQLFLLYNAALAVLKGIPVDRLPRELSGVLPGDDIGRGDLKKYDPLIDMFFFRPDWGISHFELDGQWWTISQMLPVESLFSTAVNSKHEGRKLFSVDRISRRFYAKGVNEFKVSYFKKPGYPISSNTTYPLKDDNDFELAMTIVAAHVTGETIRDGAQSQFQSFLSLIYGDDNRE